MAEYRATHRKEIQEYEDSRREIKKAYNAAYRAANLEKLKMYEAEYRYIHREKRNAYSLAYHYTPEGIRSQIKHNAKRRGNR